MPAEVHVLHADTADPAFYRRYSDAELPKFLMDGEPRPPTGAAP